MPRYIKFNKSINNKSTSNPPPPKINNDINQSPKDGITNTITSNIISGFAFGAGSSIARNTIDSLFNNNNKDESNNNKKNEQKIFDDYNECLKNNNEQFCKDFYTSPYKTNI